MNADQDAAQQETASELRDILLCNGFVPCDIPACNCGRWHHRYGLPERWAEIKDALAEAGHPLCNENGWLAVRALQELIAERDQMKTQVLKRKPDEEIRARIAVLTLQEKLYDRTLQSGGYMSALATARIDELIWVLGE